MLLLTITSNPSSFCINLRIPEMARPGGIPPRLLAETSSRNKLNRPSPPPPFRRKTDNGHKYTAISHTHTLHIVSYRQSDTLFFTLFLAIYTGAK